MRSLLDLNTCLAAYRTVIWFWMLMFYYDEATKSLVYTANDGFDVTSNYIVVPAFQPSISIIKSNNASERLHPLTHSIAFFIINRLLISFLQFYFFLS